VGARNARSERINQLRQRLAGLGFTEVYALSFVDLEDTRAKGFANGVELLGVRNPLSERWDGLRNSLLPSLGRLAETNMKKGREWIKMFEIGKVFEGTGDNFREEEHLALLSSGDRFSWVEKEETADFYSLKGDIESFFDSIGAEDVAFTSTTCPFLHPGRAAEILLDDEKLGVMGELILSQRTLRRVYVAELNLEMLLNRVMRRKFHESISKFPAVDRDIALLAADQLPFQDIATVIEREGGQYLESVRLFDLYVGDGIPEGSKSLTYRLRFRAKDRTLRDEEVDKVIRGILSSLREELNVILRGG
jgi:phenylalanyl-tRNA synthetase beta chain